MTQRSIHSGAAPVVIIHARVDIRIRGVEGERVSAETSGMWGLKVERKQDAIKVEIGSSGDVLVPYGSGVKVYAGKNITIDGIAGDVTAFSGWNLTLRDTARLVHASSGGSMDLDCRSVAGREVTFSAGRDLRVYIRDLAFAQVKIKDIGGAWEARLGSPAAGAAPLVLNLKAGGDVTLVTSLEVAALPPDYILGRVERPDIGAAVEK